MIAENYFDRYLLNILFNHEYSRFSYQTTGNRRILLSKLNPKRGVDNRQIGLD